MVARLIRDARYIALALLCALLTPAAFAALTATQVDKLLSGSTASDLFGHAVALDGNTAIIGDSSEVIGSFGDPQTGFSIGAAYVFVRDISGNWSQQAKLVPSDGNIHSYNAGDDFGYSVGLDGDTAIIGANRDNQQGINGGSAYVFVLDASNNWIEKQKLLPADVLTGYYFGWSIDVENGTAFISAPDADGNATSSGAVYVFTLDAGGNWNQQQKLLASDGGEYENFGSSVSLHGGTAIIGDDRDGEKGYAAGAAYVFVKDAGGNWVEQQKLTASDGDQGDQFGSAVKLDVDAAIIGAAGRDNIDDRVGAAYVFVKDADGNWVE
jgi:hypothetical protein